MRLGKTVAMAGLLVSCAGIFAAEGTRKRELIPDLQYGFGVATGYNSNVNSSPDNEEESFMVTLRPFLKYERDFAFGPLSLAYTPEMRWYENRPGDDVEWDHVFSFDTSLDLSPTMTLTFSDVFSNVDTDDVTEIGGVTVAGDNAYIRNRFNLDYEWEFSQGQQFISGYKNEFLEYDDDANDYRNNKLNEAYIGYKRNMSDVTKAGIKLIHGMANFYESESNAFGGITTDRDSEWTRLLLTTEIYSGPWRFNVEFGADYYRTTSEVVATGEKSEMDPYLKAKLDYLFNSTNVLSAEYIHRMIPGYREELYFAKQSQARLSYKHSFSERLHFKANGTYDTIFYPSEFARGGGVDDDRDEWMRVGFLFTYNWKQDLDILLGYSHDSLLNAIDGSEEYDINRYNVGVLYEF